MANKVHKKQYLSEMGIDVWVLRKEPSAFTTVPPSSGFEDRVESNEKIVETRAPKIETAPTPPKETRRNGIAAKASVPEFHLCFATYDDLSLIFSVPLSATALPTPMRRFVDDVALASGRPRKPTISALKWPMVKSDHIDQSEAAAKAVLQQRIDACAANAIVFGQSAQDRFGRAVQTLKLDAIEDYFESPANKRALWTQLVAFLAGIKS